MNSLSRGYNVLYRNIYPKGNETDAKKNTENFVSLKVEQFNCF